MEKLTSNLEEAITGAWTVRLGVICRVADSHPRTITIPVMHGEALDFLRK